MTPDEAYSDRVNCGDPATAVTVMMPTYRRPRSLALALAGLANQHAGGASWEILVVDNEPAPGSEAVVAEAAQAMPVALRYVREPILGVSSARNRAIAEARGEVCALLDDDVVPQPGWLTAVVEPVLAGRCEGVGGHVILDPTVTRPRWLDEVGIGGYLTRFEPATETRAFRHREVLVTANAAVRTNRLREIGGFDSRFGPRGRRHLVADDDLLSRRLMAAGCRLWYVPEAVVIHELPVERLSRRYLLRRAWLHGRSDWLLEREVLERGHLNGARPAVNRLASAFRHRLADGLGDPAVRFHLLCDLVRAVASVGEGTSWWFEGPVRGVRGRGRRGS